MQGFIQVIIFAWFIVTVSTIKCKVGHGQRGLMSSNEMSWTRTCPSVKYCFEAVTTDINKVTKLIDYPWDSYYTQYFIKSCGGDFGSDPNWHPYRDNKLPKSARKTVGAVKLNITTPSIITGQGGTELMDLNYICRRDLCSAASPRLQSSVAVLFVVGVLGVWLLV